MCSHSHWELDEKIDNILLSKLNKNPPVETRGISLIVYPQKLSNHVKLFH